MILHFMVFSISLPERLVWEVLDGISVDGVGQGLFMVASKQWFELCLEIESPPD